MVGPASEFLLQRASPQGAQDSGTVQYSGVGRRGCTVLCHSKGWAGGKNHVRENRKGGGITLSQWCTVSQRCPISCLEALGGLLTLFQVGLSLFPVNC